MQPNQMAILIAYYFSKFDKEGVRNLGFKTDSEAFEKTAKILGVKKNYIKFRRDEFDPLHPWRKGWQRPMDNRMIQANDALQFLTESELREIVEKILTDVEYHKSEELSRIASLFKDETQKKKTETAYILRGPTGRKAEEYFIKYHQNFNLPFSGHLNDTRDLGCGYDFEIDGAELFYVEVKGLANTDGGILFTNKEWQTAEKYQDKYILAIVSNIKSIPEIKFLANPTKKLKPRKSIITTVQVQWGISSKELLNA